MPPDVALRPLTPTDGPAVAELCEHSPDTGRVSFSFRYQRDAYQVLSALKPHSLGVVATRPDHAELLGLGTVSFGQCQFEGQVGPFALLDNLHVHPAFRQQGMAATLSQWRIAAARDQIGAEGLLVAAIQQDNVGSLTNARRWCRQLVGRLTLGAFPLRTRPVNPPRALSLRPAELAELDLIAHSLNTFYHAYHLYPPETGETLQAWLGQTAGDIAFRGYWVAIDAAGQIQAGLGVTEAYRLRTRQVQAMPTGIRLINRLIRLIPPDGELREAWIDKFWFADGGLEAARSLWETVRWQWRDRANVVVIPFDPRSPLAAVCYLPFWRPRGVFTMAVSGPRPMDERRLIHPLL